MVRRRPGAISQGILAAAGRIHLCALGRTGISALKREGDGATPLGRYRLRRVLYRADRTLPPPTGLPRGALRPHDGWCDDPSSGRYNRPVQLPFGAGHERMWRDDGLYDVIVVLSHNERPRVRGLGSAVFFHLSRPGLLPTEGCIAVPPGIMRRLLARCGPAAVIEVR